MNKSNPIRTNLPMTYDVLQMRQYLKKRAMIEQQFVARMEVPAEIQTACPQTIFFSELNPVPK